MRIHRRRIVPCVVLLALLTCPGASRHEAAEQKGDEWKLVWSDEFDGKEIDPEKWDFDLGNGFSTPNGAYVGGWGNDELEFYTREPKNVFVSEGALHIRAVKELYQGFNYTSGRIKTRKRDGGELFNKKYGKFEFRAKL